MMNDRNQGSKADKMGASLWERRQQKLHLAPVNAISVEVGQA